VPKEWLVKIWTGIFSGRYLYVIFVLRAVERCTTLARAVSAFLNVLTSTHLSEESFLKSRVLLSVFRIVSSCGCQERECLPFLVVFVSPASSSVSKHLRFHHSNCYVVELTSFFSAPNFYVERDCEGQL